MAIEQKRGASTATQPTSTVVISKLGEYRARIRSARRRQYLGISAFGVGLVWLIAALVYYFNLPVPGAVWFAVALTLLFPLFALLLENARKPSITETAALIDRRLDNSQRLTTSVELLSKGEAAPFTEAQINTSAQLLARVHPKEVYPAKTPWNLAATGAGLFLLALSLFLLKGGAFSQFGVGILPPDQPVVGSLAEPTPDLGLPPSELTPEPTPTPDPSQLALGSGNQQQPGGSGSEQGSTSNQGTTPKEQAEASQQAESDLSRLQRALDGQSLTQQAADALKQGNTDEAAKQITDVGAQSDQVSDAAKKGLADALEQAAKDTNSNDVLRQAEEEAAQALRDGDFNSVDPAMKDLADALKQTAANIIPQQQLAQSFPEQTPQAATSQQQDSSSSDQQSSSQDGQSENGSTDPSQPQDGQQSGQTEQTGDQAQDPAAGGGGDTGQQQGDGSGQQPSQGGGSKSESGQGDSQGGAPGEGTRVNGPKDTSTLDVPGNPFELQSQPNPGNTNPQSDPQQPEHPGLTLDGGSGGGGASPVTPGQAVNVPGETGSVPLDRWDIIRKFFSPTP